MHLELYIDTNTNDSLLVRSRQLLRNKVGFIAGFKDFRPEAVAQHPPDLHAVISLGTLVKLK